MQTTTWLTKNSFHHREFQDISALVKRKEEHKLSISLCIPTYNEEKTIGEILTCYREHLVKERPLIDEILVIDGQSTDRTIDLVKSMGIAYYLDEQPIERGMDRVKGKGEALWKSLFFAEGDIILWSDGDIKNPHPRFVYGILGPLLKEERISFVKAFYRRPLAHNRELNQDGGGRVTEILVKPLLNLFYPELGVIAQPLSGEYGGRREVLESVPFSTGYGVESGLLLDIYQTYGLEAIAQVDMEERIHYNQDLPSLKKMSFGILQQILRKLEDHGHIKRLKDWNQQLTHVTEKGLELEDLAELERPPIKELRAYQQRFKELTKLLSF